MTKKNGRRVLRPTTQIVGQEEATGAPPASPQQTFQRLDFESMPGVGLIVPEPCSPAQLVRIAARIQEEVGLYAIKSTISSALGV